MKLYVYWYLVWGNKGGKVKKVECDQDHSELW